jgi:Flp pilus assembly protein TadD
MAAIQAVWHEKRHAMSVINQVLRDLDRQHGRNDHPTPSSVRVVAGQPKRRDSRLIPVGIFLILGIATGAAFWHAPGSAISSQTSLTVVPASQIPHAQSDGRVSLRLAGWLAPPPVSGSDKTLGPPAPQLEAPVTPAAPPDNLARISPSVPAAVSQPVSRLLEGKPASIRILPREPKPEDQAEMLYRQAIELMQLGQTAAARDRLENAVSLFSGHDAARQVLSGMLIESGELPAAERLLTDGMALHAKPEFATPLARLHVERGDLAGALDVLQTIHPPISDTADHQAFLAGVLQRMENHQEAAIHYRNALRQKPNQAAWQMGLGISLQAQGQWKEAGMAYRQALAAASLSHDLRIFLTQRLRQVESQSHN